MAISTQKLLLEIQVKNQQALGKIANDVNRLNGSALSLGKAFGAVGASLAALGAVRIAKSIVETTARFEDLRTSLTAVTGSAEAGGDAFKFISKFATKTQFGIEDLSKTFIKLKSAGLQPTEELLTLFTDTAAITTDQVGTLEAVTDLYARTVSGGLGLEEIQRLGDRGVPVLRILEEQLGLTRNQISEYGKTAEGAKKITDAFATGIRQQYGGATEKVVGNLSTQFSNFSIALKNAADAFGTALAPQLKIATEQLSAWVEENQTQLPAIAKRVEEFAITFANLIKGVAEGAGKLYEITKKWGITEFGIIGFLLLGTKGKVIALAIGSIIGYLEKLTEATDKAGAATAAFADQDGIVSPDDAMNIAETANEINHMTESMREYDIYLGKLNEGTKVLGNENNYLGQELGLVIAAYDDSASAADVLATRTAYLRKEHTKLIAEFKKTFSGEILTGLDAYNNKLKETIANYNTAKLVTDTLTNATKAFETVGTNAFADVIMGTKTLQQALKEVGNAILRELVEGFVRMAIIAPALKLIAEIFGFDMATAMDKAVAAQDRLNRGLQKEIGLRLILMLLGFGSGGKIGFGGGSQATPATEGSFANGGKIGFKGFRAGGGGVGSGAYMVGERGPELFVPNAAGTIIPNNRMGSETGVTNINFNISTVDAAGFDELLLSRKSLIIGTIQQAFRQQGRRLA